MFPATSKILLNMPLQASKASIQVSFPVVADTKAREQCICITQQSNVFSEIIHFICQNEELPQSLIYFSQSGINLLIVL